MQKTFALYFGLSESSGALEEEQANGTCWGQEPLLTLSAALLPGWLAALPVPALGLTWDQKCHRGGKCLGIWLVPRNRRRFSLYLVC